MNEPEVPYTYGVSFPVAFDMEFPEHKTPEEVEKTIREMIAEMTERHKEIIWHEIDYDGTRLHVEEI